MVTMTEDRLLTVDEVAERLRVSAFSVRNWLRAGQIKGFRAGGTKAGWRIRESELQRYIAEREGQQPE
jgi:excisionase family DNA binding protein